MPQDQPVNVLFRFAWLTAIGSFFLLLFALPILAILFAASGAILGLAILLGFIVIQYPIFLLMRKWLPPTYRPSSDESSDGERFSAVE